MKDFEIGKVLEFIDKHIEEKILLNDIADDLGYSSFYVSRMFSQIMGISIISYVRMRKLQFAFSALQNSKTILEVAYQYGFESHEGFSRSFKRFFGFSPKAVKDKKISYVVPDDYALIERNIKSMNSRNIAEEMHMHADETALVKSMLDSARLMSRAKAGQEPEEESPEDEQHVEDTALFQMRQRIADLLADLSEDDSKLLTLRFGLESGLPLTPEETGRKLGLTPEEVVAREAAALARLRNS